MVAFLLTDWNEENNDAGYLPIPVLHQGHHLSSTRLRFSKKQASWKWSHLRIFILYYPTSSYVPCFCFVCFRCLVCINMFNVVKCDTYNYGFCFQMQNEQLLEITCSGMANISEQTFRCKLQKPVWDISSVQCFPELWTDTLSGKDLAVINILLDNFFQLKQKNHNLKVLVSQFSSRM